jgi:hypothetical protein
MLREMGAMVSMAFWEALATPEGVVFGQLSQRVAGNHDRNQKQKSGFCQLVLHFSQLRCIDGPSTSQSSGTDRWEKAEGLCGAV